MDLVADRLVLLSLPVKERQFSLWTTKQRHIMINKLVSSQQKWYTVFPLPSHLFNRLSYSRLKISQHTLLTLQIISYKNKMKKKWKWKNENVLLTFPLCVFLRVQFAFTLLALQLFLTTEETSLKQHRQWVRLKTSCQHQTHHLQQQSLLLLLLLVQQIPFLPLVKLRRHNRANEGQSETKHSAVIYSFHTE